MKENISNCSLGLTQCFKEGAFNSHKCRADSKKSCKWWAEKKEAFNHAEITRFITLTPRNYAAQSGAPSPGACQRTKIISKCLLIYTQIPQSTQAILQGQLQVSSPHSKSSFRFVTPAGRETQLCRMLFWVTLDSLGLFPSSFTVGYA